MGEDVLDGLKGIELVNSGFHGSMETNAVLYNPALISVGQIKQALKDTGVYLGTLKWDTGCDMVPVWIISVCRHRASILSNGRIAPNLLTEKEQAF